MHSRQTIIGEVIRVHRLRGEQVAVARGILTVHGFYNSDHFELRPARFRPARYEMSGSMGVLLFGTFDEAQALGGGTDLITGDQVVIQSVGHNVLAWDIEPGYLAATCQRTDA